MDHIYIFYMFCAIRTHFIFKHCPCICFIFGDTFNSANCSYEFHNSVLHLNWSQFKNFQHIIHIWKERHSSSINYICMKSVFIDYCRIAYTSSVPKPILIKFSNLFNNISNNFSFQIENQAYSCTEPNIVEKTIRYYSFHKRHEC